MCRSLQIPTDSSPQKKATVTQCVRAIAWQPGRTDWIKESSLANLWESNHVRPDRGLVTIYTEPRRLQTKFPYIFSLQSHAVSGEKERAVCHLSQLHVISISGTTDCIQRTNSVIQNVFKIAEACIPFPRPMSLSGTSSVGYSPYGQWSVLYSTNLRTCMWFFFSSYSTSFTVGCDMPQRHRL